MTISNKPADYSSSKHLWANVVDKSFDVKNRISKKSISITLFARVWWLFPWDCFFLSLSRCLCRESWCFCVQIQHPLWCFVILCRHFFSIVIWIKQTTISEQYRTHTHKEKLIMKRHTRMSAWFNEAFSMALQTKTKPNTAKQIQCISLQRPHTMGKI